MKDKFEKLGNHGWHDFKEEFRSIWYPYVKYGEKVLEVELGESIEIYKDCFVTAETEFEFLEKLKSIWTERYHHVISSFEELIELCNSSSNYDIWLYPDTVDLLKDGETRGTECSYSLSKEFFLDICEKLRKEKNLHISDKKKLYRLVRIKKYSETYGKIEITEENVIFVDVK